MRFIADVMGGKLARWLRVLGFDAAYSNTYVDDEIIRIAETENRVILTRRTPVFFHIDQGRHMSSCARSTTECG